MSSLSRAEIKQRAEAELKRVRAEMYAIARTVLKDKPNAPAMPATPERRAAAGRDRSRARTGLRRHARRATRSSTLAKADAGARRPTFVREKDLVTVPDAPVKIILMPEFQRGVSVAYCDSPGPLDKGLDTFYAVSPIPDDWTDGAGRFVPARIQHAA